MAGVRPLLQDEWNNDSLSAICATLVGVEARGCSGTDSYRECGFDQGTRGRRGKRVQRMDVLTNIGILFRWSHVDNSRLRAVSAGIGFQVRIQVVFTHADNLRPVLLLLLVGFLLVLI